MNDARCEFDYPRKSKTISYKYYNFCQFFIHELLAAAFFLISSPFKSNRRRWLKRNECIRRTGRPRRSCICRVGIISTGHHLHNWKSNVDGTVVSVIVTTTPIRFNDVGAACSHARQICIENSRLLRLDLARWSGVKLPVQVCYYFGA